MIDFTIVTDIDRSPADVFAFATDPERLSTWQTNTVSATAEGDLAVGTRIREVHRAPGGKELHSVVEVSAYDPPERFDLRVVEGMPIHADLEFEPVAAGTRMRFRAHGRPTGVARLLGPVLRRSLRRQFAADCDRLKQVLESA